MNDIQNIPPRFKYYVLEYLDSIQILHSREDIFYEAFGLDFRTLSVNKLTEEEFWHLFQFIVNRDLTQNAKKFKNQTVVEYKEMIYEKWKHRDKFLDNILPRGLYTLDSDNTYIGVSILIRQLFRQYSEFQQTDLQVFLKEFYDRLIKSHEKAGNSSSFGDTLYVMINETESFKDVVERLLNLPKHKFGWEEEQYGDIDEDKMECETGF